MPVSSIIITQNPTVSNAKPANYSLSLYPDGNVRFVPESESHTIVDTGWFLSASFDIEGPINILSELFSYGLARDVKVYDEVGVPRWEGLVTTLTLKTGTGSRAVTLDNIANRITVRVNVDGNPNVRPAVVTDADSQGRYGLIQKVLMFSKTDSDTTNAEDAAQVAKDNMSNPYKMVEVSQSLNGGIPKGRGVLTVECSGYAFYLKNVIYTARGNNSQANISTVIADIISSKGSFINFTEITTNTQKTGQFYNDDENAWDIITNLSKESDSSQSKYISGVREDRIFYYRTRRSASLDKLFLYRDSDGILRDFRAGEISAIRVAPDQYMRDLSVRSDMGTVYNKLRDDPQISYVQKVTYRNNDDVAVITSVRMTRRNRKLKRAIRRVLAEV